MWGPVGHPMTRPIGLQRDPADPDGFTFNPPIIALSSETAEYLANANDQGLGAGIIELRFIDDPHLLGRYSVFLQIEKIGNRGPATNGRWEGLGGQFTSGPAVASWASERLDVFARGTDDLLYHMSWTPGSGWQGWEGLGGGEITSDPAAVSWGDGRIDVFARGTDNAMYHKYYDNGWSGWEGLGGQFTSGPAVASWASERLDVFARGTDDLLIPHVLDARLRMARVGGARRGRDHLRPGRSLVGRWTDRCLRPRHGQRHVPQVLRQRLEAVGGSPCSRWASPPRAGPACRSKRPARARAVAPTTPTPWTLVRLIAPSGARRPA